jgi:4-amino-4-deoxy-L-arabinose transferase-like glycosyltransferase
MSTDVSVGNPASPRSDSLRAVLVLAGFCAYLFYFGLGAFGLVGADEPRYAQIAREMLARHDWVTPVLGGQPWLEKPALYYWQAMVSYSIFGVSDWAARIPSALDATVMVIAVYLFLRRFRPGVELDGALMTASMAGTIGFARAASTDMPLAAMFTVGMLAWYTWHETSKRFFLALFYVFVALGALAKGPVAPFLAAVIIVVFAVAKRDFRLVLRTLWIPGILLFCAVAVPWYVAVQIRNPEFLRAFILQHNLERFGTNLYHHKQPFWYYLPVALLAVVPWTVFVVAAIVETVRPWWNEKRAMLASEGALSVFLLIWLIAPIVFFSISESKLPGYVLPALPAGTVLLAHYLRRHLSSEVRPNLLLALAHAVVAAAPLVAALMLQYLVLQHRFPWGMGARISIGVGVGLAIAITWTVRTQNGWRFFRFVTLVPVVLAVAAILRIGAPALDARLSARPLSEEISHIETQRMPVAVFQLPRETEYGLAFYRNQVIERYERKEIPAGEHLVLAPEGSQTTVAAKVPGRRVSYLGTFEAQRVDFFWVSGL